MAKKLVGYKTVGLNMESWRDYNYTYEVGKTFEVKDAPNDGKSCGPGLHFCQNKKDIMSYCDASEYILLQVEADPKDVLGKDDTKTRVSKLKVVKVLEKVELYGATFKVARKECENVAKSLSNVKSVASTQKLTTLFNAVKKQDRQYKKMRVITNDFELNHWVNNYNPELDLEIDNYYDDACSIKCNLYIHHEAEFRHTLDVDGSDLYCYFASVCSQHMGASTNKTLAPRAKAYMDFLKAGVIPLGGYQDTLLVYPLPVKKARAKKKAA